MEHEFSSNKEIQNTINFGKEQYFRKQRELEAKRNGEKDTRIKGKGVVVIFFIKNIFNKRRVCLRLFTCFGIISMII